MSNRKQFCIQCSQKPENILILSCQHCICLCCSSKNIQYMSETQQWAIICSKCQMQTFLDDDLLHEIKRYKKVHKPQTKTSALKPKQSSPNKVYQSIKDNSNNQYQSLEKMCFIHTEYSLMYCCKTCNQTLICPECAIHGHHAGHTVNSILKEAQSIQMQLENDIHKIQIKLSQIHSFEEQKIMTLNKKRQEICRLMKLAKLQYLQIIESIEKQQANVMHKCQELLQKYQREDQQCKEQIQKQICIQEQQKKEIQNVLNPLFHYEGSRLNNCNAILKNVAISVIEKYQEIVKKRSNKTQISPHNSIFVQNKQHEGKNKQDEEALKILSSRIDKISLRNHQSFIKNQLGTENQNLSFQKTNQNINHKNQELNDSYCSSNMKQKYCQPLRSNLNHKNILHQSQQSLQRPSLNKIKQKYCQNDISSFVNPMNNLQNVTPMNNLNNVSPMNNFKNVSSMNNMSKTKRIKNNAFRLL